MENSDYVYRRENKGIFGQRYNLDIDVRREEGILEIMKDIKNLDIQGGILEMGGVEKRI